MGIFRGYRDLDNFCVRANLVPKYFARDIVQGAAIGIDPKLHGHLLFPGEGAYSSVGLVGS